MPLAPGTRLGPYEIVAPLGAGGMGEVYRARDTRLQRDVAIKILPAATADDPQALRRMEQEARTVAALNHPNLVSVYDIGAEPGGSPYVVMELLEGESLRQRLNTGGAMGLRKAADCGIQIARGLAAAHEKGVIHRDLKPENIFLCSDGRVKILDFGLAKIGLKELADAPTVADAGAASAPGTVLGTVGYMAPEQVRGQATDARSDLFSFGAVLYEMLSGRRAFGGGSAADVMSAILKEEPAELADPGALPLDPIVRHCLEKEPRQRYQSASDIAFQLGTLSRSTSSGSSMAAPVVSPPRRRGRLLATASVVIVAVAGFWFARVTASAPPLVTYSGLTGQPQAIFNARFAPLSNAVVFSSASEGTVPQVYELHTDYPLPQPVGPPDTELLAVSRQDELAVLANARWISQRNFDGTLAEMPLGGGVPRPLLQHVGDADWSPDGTQLAVFAGVGGDLRIEYPIGHILYRSTAAYLSDLRISPDGAHIAFFEHPVHGDDRGSLDVVDLQGHRTVLASDYVSLEGIVWSKDGKTIYFGGSRAQDDRNLIRAASLSGRMRSALASPEDMWPLDLDGAGHVLAASVADTNTLMAKTPAWPSPRDISWLALSITPKLSPDGGSILFTEASEQAGPNYSLLLRNLASSQAVRIGDGIAQGFSPDGAWALSVLPSAPPQLVLYPTGAGEKRVLSTPGIESFDDFAGFFPDGRSVMFCGVAAGARDRCYQLPLAPGARRAITPPATGHGLLSADGASLLARTDDGHWAVYSVAAASEVRPVPWLAPIEDNPMMWTKDGRSVLVLNNSSWPAPVQQLDLATGQRTTLRSLDLGNRPGALAVDFAAFSPDLKTYAYDFDAWPSRLVLISGLR